MRRSPVLIAILLLADLGAQQPAPARQPCTGRVVDEHGATVAQAEVTFVFTPSRISPGLRDVVTVTTDERGRFLAPLCLGNLYTAWAMGPASEDGSRLASAPHDLLGAGRTVEIALIQRAQSRHLQLSGLDKWTDVKIAHAILHPDARHDFGIDLGPLVDGAIDLPPSPVADASLFLVDEHGHHVDLIGILESQPGGTSLRVAPPRAFEGLAVDRDGSPLQGAVAEMLVRTAGLSGDDPFGSIADAVGFATWRPIGTSDAQGRIVARLPKLPGAHLAAAQGERLPVTSVRISVAGCAPQYLESPETGLRIDDVKTADGHESYKAREEDRAQERVELLPLRDLPFEVTGRDRPEGADLGAWLLLVSKGQEIADPRVPLILSDPHGGDWRIRTGASACVQPWYSLSVVGSPPLRSELPDQVVQDGTKAIPIELGKLKRRNIEIVDPNGAPAAAAVAVARQVIRWTRLSIRSATDAAGRLELWLPDEPRVIYATTGSMDAMRWLDGTERDGPLRLVLEPIPRMRVHVVDPKHQSLAGAHAWPAVLAGRFPVRLPDPAQEAERLVAEALWVGYIRMARSGSDGWLEIPVLAHGMGPHEVVLEAGDRRSIAIPLAAGERPEVVLR